MKGNFGLTFLVLLCSTTLVASVDINRIQTKLKQYLKTNTVPEQVTRIVAAFDDSLDILKCIPIFKRGNCYRSLPCRIPKIKYDVNIVLSICKSPWLMKFEFVDFKIPSYLKLDIRPIVINFDHNSRNALFTIKSDTTAKVKVKYIGLNVAKARFIIDGTVRYDCTKPSGPYNWIKRSQYNIRAPRPNAMYYKLKIRLEIKKKNFKWFKFNYKCVKCEDLVNKSKVFGYGPYSCVAEAQRYRDWLENLRCQGRRCIRP